MPVDYTTVLDRPCVSVEGPTQQGIESVMEVTPASDITSDGSSDPSLWLRLLRELRVMARTTIGIVSVSVRVSSSSRDVLRWCRGASLAEVHGKAASQTPPLAEARGKSPAAPGPAPAPVVGAPAPRAGDDAVSPGGWTGLAWHPATQWMLHQVRRQKGDHRLTCSAPDTSHL
jgi:hypothetical protein